MTSSPLLRNTTALLVVQITNQLLPFITIPYLTRTLGIEGYGVYAYAISMIGFVTVITDFGFNLWATAEVSKNKKNKYSINRLFGAVLGAQIYLTLLSTLLIILFSIVNNMQEDYRGTFLGTMLPIIGIVFQPIWLFYGLEKMVQVTFFTLAARIVFTCLVFICISGKSDLTLLIILNGISQVFAALIAWFLLAKAGYLPVWPRQIDCYRVLKRSFPFFLSRLAVLTYTVAGGIFLGMFSTVKNVAIYSVAEQIYRGLQSLLSPIGQVMYPYMMRTRNHLMLIRIILLSAICVIIGAATISYYDANIIGIIYGSEYVIALPVLNIFLIIIIINTPASLLGYPMLGGLGALHLANNSVFLAGILQIFALIILYFFGIVTPLDVAVTVLIAELAVLVIRLYFVIKKLNAINRSHI